MFYELLGRVIDSDVCMPCLSARSPATPDIRIRQMVGPPAPAARLVFESERLREDGSVSARLGRDDSGYSWSFRDLADFCLSRDGSLIEWSSHAGERRDLVTLLAGSVVAFALQLQGLTGLHGNGLVHGTAAFGLLGPSGYGKSSLSSMLMRRGCDFLTDDFLAIEFKSGTPMALPGLQRLKLWPDAVERLLPRETATEAYVSWLPKQSISPVALGGGIAEARPLAALFVLVPIAAPEAPTAQRLHGEQALAALVANSYQAHLLTAEPELMASRLDFLQALLDKAPVYALGCPRSFDRLRETAEVVLSHVGLAGGKAAASR
ncbi:MAG TPA: hypothetical protein VI876_08780 [Dehalococcoidia bacterium]|nr:hypothetical protein [Dehalococcoidia bacterium]